MASLPPHASLQQSGLSATQGPQGQATTKASQETDKVMAKKGPMTAVRAFLVKLHLDEYTDKFQECGFDDLTFLCKMSSSELDELGKDVAMRKGHLLKLKSSLASESPPLPATQQPTEQLELIEPSGLQVEAQQQQQRDREDLLQRRQEMRQQQQHEQWQLLQHSPLLAMAPPPRQSAKAAMQAMSCRAQLCSSPRALAAAFGPERKRPNLSHVVVGEADGLRLQRSVRSSTGYKGVSIVRGGASPNAKPYAVTFRAEHCGYFATAIEAAVHYAKLQNSEGSEGHGYTDELEELSQLKRSEQVAQVVEVDDDGKAQHDGEDGDEGRAGGVTKVESGGSNGHEDIIVADDGWVTTDGLGVAADVGAEVAMALVKEAFALEDVLLSGAECGAARVRVAPSNVPTVEQKRTEGGAVADGDKQVVAAAPSSAHGQANEDTNSETHDSRLDNSVQNCYAHLVGGKCAELGYSVCGIHGCILKEYHTGECIFSTIGPRRRRGAVAPPNGVDAQAPRGTARARNSSIRCTISTPRRSSKHKPQTNEQSAAAAAPSQSSAHSVGASPKDTRKNPLLGQPAHHHQHQQQQEQQEQQQAKPKWQRQQQATHNQWTGGFDELSDELPAASFGDGEIGCFCDSERHLLSNSLSFSGVWVQCDECTRWCHGECAGLDKEQAEAADTYICEVCSARDTGKRA